LPETLANGVHEEVTQFVIQTLLFHPGRLMIANLPCLEKIIIRRRIGIS
jgi:hypothetical protein